MIRFSTALAALSLAAAPAAASGPGFLGATADFSFGNSFEYSYSSWTPSVSATFGLGGGVIAQVDLSYQRYTDSSTHYWGYGLHLGYAVSDSLKVAAFYHRNFISEFSSGGDPLWGVEFRHTGLGISSLPRVALEGYYMRYDGYANILDLRAETALSEAVDLIGGVTLSNWGSYYHTLTLGARYNTPGNTYLQGLVQQQFYSGGQQETHIRLSAGVNLGQGATFRMRRYFDLYPGW
jgi:hypothetical protein